MADRLTQLQDALDQWMTQMYAVLRYHATHHPYSSISAQPDANPHSIDNRQQAAADATADAAAAAQPPTVNGAPHVGLNQAQGPQEATQQQQQEEQAQQQAQQAQRKQDTEDEHVPDSPTTFDAALKELARDIVIKEQQCEFIVDRLPGIGTSEREQEERLQILDRELRDVNEEAARAAEEKERLLEVLDRVLVGVRRV